jgi:protein MYSM1
VAVLILTRKILYVNIAIPCKSISTGIQCEMDPISETLARDVVEKLNLSIVGWYHSHPIFIPNPSMRDIENQSRYQVRKTLKCDFYYLFSFSLFC